MGDLALFPGFTAHDVDGDGARIHCVVGGAGPPLLLLHGYPQTHAMWHRVAPALAAEHTVVCADLRGYGDSAKPPSGPPHAAYSKRAMAADMVAVMRTLGFDALRPGRATTAAGASRIGCASIIRRPSRRVAVLDISPTRLMFERTDQAFATAYYHWFFLIQPFDLPERLIGADPAYYIGRKMKKLERRRDGVLRPARLGRVRALLRRSGDHPRVVRGLSGGRVDRPRARPRRRGSAGGMPVARAVGRQGRGPPAVRSGGRLAQRRDDVRGARDAHGTLHGGGSARGNARAAPGVLQRLDRRREAQAW